MNIMNLSLTILPQKFVFSTLTKEIFTFDYLRQRSSMKIVVSISLLLFLINSKLIAQTFIGSFNLVSTQNYPNGSSRNDTIGYYFGKEKTAILIFGRRNDPDMRMVFSPMDTTITSLFEINGKKGGFILPMDEEHWPGMLQALRPFGVGLHAGLNYTGEEKDIEGFVCKEVLAENEDYTAKMWLAEDIPLSMTKVLSYQSVGKGKSKKEIELFDQLGVEGLTLELFLKSKKGKADVTLHLIDFSEAFDDSIFSDIGHTLSKIE